MPTVQLDGNVSDQNGVSVPGALVYIYDGGTLASLTDSLGQSATNPRVAGQDGYWSAYVETAKYYTLRYYWGGRERLVEANILAGNPPIGPNADPNLRPDLATSSTTKGTALIKHRPLGNDGPGQTVQTKLDYLGAFGPEYRLVTDPAGTDYYSMIRAFNALGASSGVRTQPDGFPNYGFGRVTLPKGIMHSDAGFDYGAGFLGLDIVGANMFSSALTTNSTTGYGLRLGTYEGVHVADLMLRNKANAGVPGGSDTSVGIRLVTGGSGNGGYLMGVGLAISGYQTSIKQDPSNTGNGDKSLFVGCRFDGRYIYDQGTNKQAIGWTFLNCGARAENAHFKLGGAGETLIANYTSDVPATFIELPEGTGNGGVPSQGHYIGGRTSVMSSKLEYQAASVKLLDASACQLLTSDVNGSGVGIGAGHDLVFREVSIARGAVVDVTTNVIFKVGNTTNGSDNIRLKCEGGNIEGVIQVASHKPLTDANVNWTNWWSFRDMVLAPNPETAQYLGAGAHYMMEWRRNGNVALDQYRAGQAGNVSIDSRKSYLAPTQGKYLIDGRVSGFKTNIGGRFGKDFTLALPNTLRASGAMGGNARAIVAQLGLSVWIENPTAAEHATEVTVQQFTDGTFATPIGSAVSIAAGAYGLYPIHNTLTNVADGNLYVRITKTAADQFSEGLLVFDYFPYLGA